MKKLINILSIMLCLIMSIGCNEGKLSEYYNENELREVTEDVINKLNNKNYDIILEDSSEEFKISFPDNKLEEYWDGFSKNIGDFDSIIKTTLVEKNGYAVSIVNVKYTDKRVTFTLYFNKDMKLSGIHMK